MAIESYLFLCAWEIIILYEIRIKKEYCKEKGKTNSEGKACIGDD